MSHIDPGESLQRGLEALAQKRFADAAAALDVYLRTNPDDENALARYGYARAAANDEFIANISDPATDGPSLLAYAKALSAKLPRPKNRALRPGPRRPGRLRVGFLSPDFRRHSCAFFLRAPFEHRDRTRFEFHCFADFNDTKRDALSDWFQHSADRWTETTRMTMPELAAHIADAAIDVLVDVGGYSFGSTVSVCTYRPARKVVSWLGFPASTGISEIGYRLGDAVSDPAGSGDAHFGETIVRLDGPFLCFTPDAHSPEPAPLPACDVCFASFNATHKINLPVAKLWTRIVSAVPRAQLLLKCNLREDPSSEPYLRALFAAAGLAPDRLVLLGFTANLREHLATYARVHVALDPFPYNGTTTTCEALWMGVPVVTLGGGRHAARVGASVLHHVGLDALIAADEDAYVETAVALAHDSARLAAYRSTMRARLGASALFDAPRWTRLFEAGLAAIDAHRPTQVGAKP